jgi:2-dehydro-3-deoxy-D-arabinonate dehydratase
MVLRIIRFLDENKKAQLAAVVEEGYVYSLPFGDFLGLVDYANKRDTTPLGLVQEVIGQSLPINVAYEKLEVLVPIEAKEVWASGVTFERSRVGRNFETTGGNLNAETFYDKVYDAKRPEIFFKSTPERTAGPDKELYLRSDSNWQIPEPEIGLVLSKTGEILGYTIGNDMSCRDIEGENPLYLPQAKIWERSCSIGPAIRLAETIENPYEFQITCRIFRDNHKLFEESASLQQLKRKLEELVSYLIQDNVIFDGTVLLTGTCIVPPNDFSLQVGDRVEIEVPGIGTLSNGVTSRAKIK